MAVLARLSQDQVNHTQMAAPEIASRVEGTCTIIVPDDDDVEEGFALDVEDEALFDVDVDCEEDFVVDVDVVFEAVLLPLTIAQICVEMGPKAAQVSLANRLCHFVYHGVKQSIATPIGDQHDGEIAASGKVHQMCRPFHFAVFPDCGTDDK
jgi:hypothetical protein